MPAISADPITLPRVITSPGLSAVPRPVTRITTAPKGTEGEGFPVRRAFAGVPLQDLDPFIHMDQMGQVHYAPYEPRGTDWHPHRGFETVTYIIDGTFAHQDSHGGGGIITDGATQWMTAGRGILHIETPTEELVRKGGMFHGVQLWVNLPKKSKMIAPRYQNLEGPKVKLLTSADGASLIRLIAGTLGNHKGPGSTQTPILLAHVSIPPGARVEIPWNRDHNALAYCLAGAGSVGPNQAKWKRGQLAVFGHGDTLIIEAANVDAAKSDPFEVLLLGGRPLREPVVTYGPFVMNTRSEVMKAVEDYQAGRFGKVPAKGLRPFRR
jgi:redox-sensitive bicupin YhaK (pirin superfamily)